MNIAVLIPCYNESATIEKVIRDFRNELPEATIYVYDNNSSDGTYQIARQAGAVVVKECRQGKGNVVRSMFKNIDADIYVLVDGDDTYPVEYVHELIRPVAEDAADLVIGDRLSNGTYSQENKRAFHNFGNSLVRRLINFLFRSNIEDIMTGYRVFSRDFVKTFPVLSKGFEIETEMTIYALHNNYRITETPIVYRDRPEGSVSKLNTFTDGFKVLKIVFWLFKDFKPLIFFSLLSVLMACIGLIIGMPAVLEYIKYSYVYKVPSAVLAAALEIIALLLFACGLILDTTVKHQRALLEQQSILFKVLDGHQRKKAYDYESI